MRDRKSIRQRAEEQQKLAAVGQLAAGIAHDFNNLLTGILGHAELIQFENGLSPDSRQSLEIIIALEAGDKHYLVEAAPTQMQRVVTNLAVNARDAMQEGGTPPRNVNPTSG